MGLSTLFRHSKLQYKPFQPFNFFIEMKKVTIIALGGCTCSGKTTLAKILSRILPDPKLLHEDDFAPNAVDVPYHPIYTDLQDWDSAPTA